MRSILDLHVHTTAGSPDSSLTPEELVEESRRIGLSGVAVTEHNVWPRHSFAAFAEGQDATLIRGLELYTPLGHIIAFGLDEHVIGFGGDIEAVRRLRTEADRVGAFLVLAHPFRFLFDLPGYYKQNILFRDHVGAIVAEQVATHPVFELVHDIEVVNGGNVESENRFAQEVARILGKPGTGGSDAHSTHGLGKGTTAFNGEIRTERDLLEALHAGDYSPLEGFHVGLPVSY